jgi:hypothetical protein
MKMRLEPVLPAEIAHLHDLELVVSIDPSELGKVLVEWMPDVVHRIDLALLKNVVEKSLPVQFAVGLPRFYLHFLEASAALQNGGQRIASLLRVVVTIVKVYQLELVVSGGSSKEFHADFRSALPAKKGHILNPVLIVPNFLWLS